MEEHINYFRSLAKELLTNLYSYQVDNGITDEEMDQLTEALKKEMPGINEEVQTENYIQTIYDNGHGTYLNVNREWYGKLKRERSNNNV